MMSVVELVSLIVEVVTSRSARPSKMPMLVTGCVSVSMVVLMVVVVVVVVVVANNSS